MAPAPRAAPDEILTMRPHFFARIAGSTAWVQRKADFRSDASRGNRHQRNVTIQVRSDGHDRNPCWRRRRLSFMKTDLRSLGCTHGAARWPMRSMALYFKYGGRWPPMPSHREGDAR